MFYTTALFLHVLGAIGLVAGSTIKHFFHYRLRRAGTTLQMREWSEAMGTVSKVMPVFSLTLLAFGVYMTVTRWGWSHAWIDLALALLISITVVSPIMFMRFERAIAAAVKADDAMRARQIVSSLALNIVSTGFTCIAYAAVLLMVARPPLTTCLIIVAVAFVFGALLGRVFSGLGSPAKAEAGAPLPRGKVASSR